MKTTNGKPAWIGEYGEGVVGEVVCAHGGVEEEHRAHLHSHAMFTEDTAYIKPMKLDEDNRLWFYFFLGV